jgi:hypothetical protein
MTAQMMARHNALRHNETPFFSAQPTIKKLVGLLGGTAIAGNCIYAATRMKARCSTLSHCISAYLHRVMQGTSYCSETK